MHIGRTIPPAAAPIYPKDILSGFKGILRGEKEINRFESELKDYYKVKYCYLVSSGKAALTILLKALQKLHPERDEVLIPAYTCYSVPAAILKAGLKIKLCDISPVTLDFDFDQLEKIIGQSKNSKSKSSILAVIPTYILGLPVDVEKVKKLIFDYKISIIEDAAQAMGGGIKGKKFGTFGEAGFFSLGRGKAFSTVEGGIILTNDKQIADNIVKQIETTSSYTILEILKLMVYSIVLLIFMQPKFYWIPKLFPFLKIGETIFEKDFKIKKFSSFQAGLTQNWREKITNFSLIRIENSKYWASFFKNVIYNTKFIIFDSHSNNPLIRFPLAVNDERVMQQILSQKKWEIAGIGPTYPDTINNVPQIKENFKGLTFQCSESLIKKIITIPNHILLSLGDKMRIKNMFDDIK